MFAALWPIRLEVSNWGTDLLCSLVSIFAALAVLALNFHIWRRNSSLKRARAQLPQSSARRNEETVMSWHDLLGFILILAAAAAIPGPDVAAIIGSGLSGGSSVGVQVGFRPHPRPCRVDDGGVSPDSPRWRRLWARHSSSSSSGAVAYLLYLAWKLWTAPVAPAAGRCGGVGGPSRAGILTGLPFR